MHCVKWVFLAFLFLFSIRAGAGRHRFDKQIEAADARPSVYCSQLIGKRIGLVVNQTSRIGDSLLPDVLMARGVTVVRIFCPEHGFRGDKDAGSHVGNSIDSATGVQIVSLYGKNKKPSAQDMKDIDVLVYDLQDVGVRFYTYISTLEYCMEACSENRKSLLVLDRPDPNGFYLDGPVLDTHCRSFVGMQPIPVVYGMTAAEYAQMLKGEGWVKGAIDLDLKIVPCNGYDHSKYYELPVPPSPNLRQMAAVYAYPSLCLFEGTKVSVGRGTPHPFTVYGCPEFSGQNFNYQFTPMSGLGASSPLYELKICYGEDLGRSVQDILDSMGNKFRLNWLIRAYDGYPAKEKFFNSFFTKLAGNEQLQEQIRKGLSEDEIRETWQPAIKKFKAIRKKYLLYKDFE